ncbi:unnamed protein product [Durusdinium trenchii]|uniref:Uncharacterized protein n=2 Tax=Durusdinium trenchii TaxID=1381693 RepID=A0ABP0PNP3_9DINO
MSASIPAVLVRNGRAASPWLSKHDLLHNYSGAYTTARTVSRNSVFELSMHCQRLADTAQDVLQRKLEETPEMEGRFRQALAFLEPAAIQAVFKRECLTALDYLHGVEDGPCEYQVTVLLTCDTVTEANDKGFDVYTFVQALPFVEATVAVEARQAERSNPTVKDVQWVNDRQHLEEIQSQAGVNEVIMHDERGKITEGLQTNFFAERNGTLYTAPDDRVLSGTVRKVVLEVAQEHGIPVELECPNISEMNQWDSCFICSTSRLVKPIHTLTSPDFGERRFSSSGLAHRLEALVLESMQRHAEPLTE